MGIYYPGLVKGFFMVHGQSHSGSQELYLRKLTNGKGNSPFFEKEIHLHMVVFSKVILVLRGCVYIYNRSLLKNFIRKLLASFWPPRKTNFNGYFWDSTGDGHQPVGIVEGLQRISDGRFIISIGCRWNLSVLTTQERTRSGQIGLLIIDCRLQPAERSVFK